jgi:hypothetical protein
MKGSERIIPRVTAQEFLGLYWETMWFPDLNPSLDAEGVDK